MSYRRQLRRRRALGGISSQPPGPAVSVYALGSASTGRKGGSSSGRGRIYYNDGGWLSGLAGVTSQPPGRPVSKYALGSLGDDPGPATTLSQPTVLDAQTAAWQQQVLANQQAQLAQADKDHLQKWVQIAVTASIPLFGAIWKLVFGAGRD